MRTFIAALFVIALPFLGAAAGESKRGGADDAIPAAGMTEWDRINLERNLRWMLARERAGEQASNRRAASPAKPRVAVFADAGVWHVAARSIVEALEKAKVPCRVIDRTLVTSAGLEQFEAVVFPGGWAPFQRTAIGEAGFAAIKRFVEGGGRCLGCCAGAYLLSRDVRYEGKNYLYPIGLLDGTAHGPIKGLAAFPDTCPVRLTVATEGKSRGVAAVAKQKFMYGGGPCFLGGTGVVVLASYQDGSSAIVARKVGKGEVILVGVHLERPSPDEGGDAAPPPAVAGELFKALLLKQ
jgi:glutamine amidotransferase-like uncharacterized protein